MRKNLIILISASALILQACGEAPRKEKKTGAKSKVELAKSKAQTPQDQSGGEVRGGRGTPNPQQTQIPKTNGGGKPGVEVQTDNKENPVVNTATPTTTASTPAKPTPAPAPEKMPEMKLGQKPELKVEAKPETKPEAKSEAKSESKEVASSQVLAKDLVGTWVKMNPESWEPRISIEISASGDVELRTVRSMPGKTACYFHISDKVTSLDKPDAELLQNMAKYFKTAFDETRPEPQSILRLEMKNIQLLPWESNVALCQEYLDIKSAQIKDPEQDKSDMFIAILPKSQDEFLDVWTGSTYQRQK